jgi:hypothetical protein
VVYTRTFVHTAGGNTLDKLEDYSKRDIMNIISLSNIEIQIQICKKKTA